MLESLNSTTEINNTPNITVDKKAVMYRPNFKASEDKFVRSTEIEQKQKEQKRRELLGYIQTGLGMTVSVAFLALISHQMGWLDFLKKSKYKFSSLSKNDSIPTLQNCNTLSDKMKSIIEKEVELSKANADLLKKAGNPCGTNMMVLCGLPGAGKSYFADVYAKTIDAKVIKVKYSDFGDKYVAEGSKNITNFFETATKVGEKNPKENYVIVFDEFDALAPSLDRISGEGASSMAKTEERTSFLLGLEKLQKRAPNVKIIATTNQNPKLLDKATLSRMGNIYEIELPNKKIFFNHIMKEFKNVEGFEDYAKNHKDEVEKLAQIMENRLFSFRNANNVINNAKQTYLNDLVKDNKKVFNLNYIENAIKELKASEAELEQGNGADQLSEALKKMMQNN